MWHGNWCNSTPSIVESAQNETKFVSYGSVCYTLSRSDNIGHGFFKSMHICMLLRVYASAFPAKCRRLNPEVTYLHSNDEYSNVNYENGKWSKLVQCLYYCIPCKYIWNGDTCAADCAWKIC
jgi:hypothetical protein